MPPETESIPLPEGRGLDAMEWLESKGLVAQIPTIRSSDYEAVLSNPFRYYLTRRLGLAPRISWSAALSRGSWVHKALELDSFVGPLSDERFQARYHRALEARLAELREICASVGIVGDPLRDILDREHHDAELAMAWYQAGASVHIADSTGGFRRYLAKPQWRLVAREPVIRLKYRRTWRVAQPDIIMLNIRQNRLWLVDFKTTSLSPRERLSFCPIEFQTIHYLHCLNDALHDGLIHKHFPEIPPDATVGGMIHVGLMKPSIVLSSQDRNYEIVRREITRGPNKGEIREEKKYFGEPLRENYLVRVRDWMQGTGDYVHLAKQRNSDPACNMSFTPAGDILSDTGSMEYEARLSTVYRYAACDPIPHNFPMSVHALILYGAADKFSPFFLTPVDTWPALVQELDLIIRYRDEPDQITEPSIQETPRGEEAEDPEPPQ